MHEGSMQATTQQEDRPWKEAIEALSQGSRVSARVILDHTR